MYIIKPIYLLKNLFLYLHLFRKLTFSYCLTSKPVSSSYLKFDDGMDQTSVE